MDNEKIRKEFESWYEENYNADPMFRRYDDKAMEMGYLAAAQSRDELIGRLVKAVNNWIPLIEPYSPRTINKTYQLRNKRWKQDCNTLAEAKAKGYGE